MFGRKYVLHCNNCRTEFCFSKTKRMHEFSTAYSTKCPCCGNQLSIAPFPHTMLTPPPNLETYPEYVRRIDMDSVRNMLDFDKWPKRVN